MDFPINYIVVLVLSILGIGFVSVCLKRIDRLHVGFRMGAIAALALVGIFGLVTLYLELTTPNQTVSAKGSEVPRFGDEDDDASQKKLGEISPTVAKIRSQVSFMKRHCDYATSKEGHDGKKEYYLPRCNFWYKFYDYVEEFKDEIIDAADFNEKEFWSFLLTSLNRGPRGVVGAHYVEERISLGSKYVYEIGLFKTKDQCEEYIDLAMKFSGFYTRACRKDPDRDPHWVELVNCEEKIAEFPEYDIVLCASPDMVPLQELIESKKK